MRHNDIARIFRKMLMLRGIPVDISTWDHVIYKFAANNAYVVDEVNTALKEAIDDTIDKALKDAINSAIYTTLTSINNNTMMDSRSPKERLDWKSTISFTCPKCDTSDDYVVYLNVEQLICVHCYHESDVKLYCRDIELIAK